MKKFFFFILLSFIIYSCKPDTSGEKISICSADDGSGYSTASLEGIMSGKTEQGKVVAFNGVFQYNFEDVAIYAKKGSENALWLNFDESVYSKSDSLLRLLSGKNVTVTGKIDLLHKGHLGAYAGALDSVFCIKESK